MMLVLPYLPPDGEAAATAARAARTITFIVAVSNRAWLVENCRCESLERHDGQ